MVTGSSGVESDNCGGRWLDSEWDAMMFDKLFGEDCSDGTLLFTVSEL